MRLLRSACLFALFLSTVILLKSADALTEKVLHKFVGVSQHGDTPQGNLIADAAGNLYGTTLRGGAYDNGTVFELTPNSDGHWKAGVLYSFKGNDNDAAYPSPGLVFDAVGNLYGTTGGDNLYGWGTVFELSPSSKGWIETILHVFQGDGSDGAQPNGNLVFDKAGNLYGTAAIGGNSGLGTVFELTRGSNGQWTETVIHYFDDYDGANPVGGLVLDEADNLYGTAKHGGLLKLCQGNSLGCGTVFTMKHVYNGNRFFELLYRFGGNYPNDGQWPVGTPTLDASGNLYGVAGNVVYQLSRASGWKKEDVLYTFTGGTDGAIPNGNLVFDYARNIYGTTQSGGSSGCDFVGCGTAFKLSLDHGTWKEEVLYAFSGQADGSSPNGGVILDQAGNLEGVASTGGIAGVGAVFTVARNQRGGWKESVLYGFTSSDGADPMASLVSDSQGNLYGTTSRGGNGEACLDCGAVFRMSRGAKGERMKSLIYSFKGGNDGGNPSSLVFDNAGNLFGTTESGGGLGTVFELSPSSNGRWAERVLYNFRGRSKGAYPSSGVVFDAAGNLYGETDGGGTGVGAGVVYELSQVSGGHWKQSVLYSFHARSDGGQPMGGLVLDAAGNLYGATACGGSGYSCYGYGVVFELSPSTAGWKESVLYTFSGGADGGGPGVGLVFDHSGNLYGATYSGGDQNCLGKLANGCGTVFELSPSPSGWNLTTLHTFGSVGTSDGANPSANVIFDSVGHLYGTTSAGGYSPDGCAYDGYGTVFELTPSTGGNWKENVLHRFKGRDGAFPSAGLILDSAGNLYGTTSSGGDILGNYNHGLGTVFQIKPSSEMTPDTSPLAPPPRC